MGKHFNSTMMHENYITKGNPLAGLRVREPKVPVVVAEKVPEPEALTISATTGDPTVVDPNEVVGGLGCEDCNFIARRDSKNPAASLRFHRMGKHKGAPALAGAS